jgi:hypothetical protein
MYVEMDVKNIRKHYSSKQVVNDFPRETLQSDKLTVKKTMPVITCICGEKILVLPDLSEMNRALRKHIADHKRMAPTSEKTISAYKLENYLVGQLLSLTSEMGN